MRCRSFIYFYPYKDNDMVVNKHCRQINSILKRGLYLTPPPWSTSQVSGSTQTTHRSPNALATETLGEEKF